MLTTGKAVSGAGTWCSLVFVNTRQSTVTQTGNYTTFSRSPSSSMVWSLFSSLSCTAVKVSKSLPHPNHLLTISSSHHHHILHIFITSSPLPPYFRTTSLLHPHHFFTSSPLPHQFLITSSIHSHHFLINFSSPHPHHFLATSSPLHHIFTTSSSISHHHILTTTTHTRTRWSFPRLSWQLTILAVW